MKATKFVIDAIPGHAFDGFTRGETWNGWARPFFTYDESRKIVTAHKQQGLNAYYDQEADGFAFEMIRDGGEYDIFHGVEISNIKLYPVGAGYWIWEEVAEGG